MVNNMLWLNDIKGTMFKVEVGDKVVKATLSTSEKKQDGTYENSSWFVAFVGNCKEKAARLQEKDRITVTKGKLTNVYNKEQKKSYLNFTIFAFECERLNGDNLDDFRTVEDDEIPF